MDSLKKVKKFLKKYWFRFKDDKEIYYEKYFCSTDVETAEGYAEAMAKNYNLTLIEYIGWTEIDDEGDKPDAE